MLNEKKVLVMTRLARMEQKKENFLIRDYYISDYIRSNVLKTFFRITLGYVILVLMIALYQTEYLIANAVALDYKKLGIMVLVFYVLLLAVYLLGTVLTCTLRYKKAKRFITRYEKGLDLLQRYYRSEQERKRGGQAS